MTTPSSLSVMTVQGTAAQFWGLSPFARTDTQYNERLPYTLNARLGVCGSVLPAAEPKLRYFGIGIQGYYNVGSTGIRPYHPSASGIWMFTPIPFRIVPVDADLSAEERAQYRMRELRTIVTSDESGNSESNQYFLYWLKCLDFVDGGQVTTNRIYKTEEGNYVSELYVPTESEILNEPSPATENQTTEVADTIVTKILCTGQVTPDEVLESINVLHDGNLTLAKVSEFGLFTGNDEVVSAEDGLGGTIEITEAIYTHMIVHRCSIGTDMSIAGGDPLTVSMAIQDGNLVVRA